MIEMNQKLLPCCALAVVLLGACDRELDQAEPLEAEPAVAALADSDTVYTPQSGRVALAPERIYFTLTDHEWYARGEPLVHGNVALHPAGMPVSATLDEMHHAGEYHGVDYYVRDGDDTLVVYVPVFAGYWQPFRGDTARAR